MALAMRRAAFRNRIHVQRLHALLEGRVVNRQRTFQKRLAREGDQAQAVRSGVCINSSAASLARSSRLGAMSVASMDFEVSIATTMSKPFCSTSCRSYPCCGRARAMIKANRRPESTEQNGFSGA